MKRIFLIATLIVGACAVAPAQASQTNARAEGQSSFSARQFTGGNLRLEKNTSFHLAVSESAGMNNDR